ncbi:MAG TPA: SRPBCC family protein [Micromonosporaceae bacterium]|nr:SRPBCC family protein [Micromonosporaceae bacterium]
MTHRPIDPGPLAQVSLEATGDRWTLVFVRELPHPPAKVWQALTDPAQVGEWAPYTVDRNLGSIGEATLTMVDGDTAEPMSATVLRAGEPRLLEHTWGDDLLRWVLTPTETGTRLTLRHTLAERDWTPRVAAGWHICLVVAQRLLDGDPVGPIRGEAAREHGWDELPQSYAGRLGIVLDPMVP